MSKVSGNTILRNSSIIMQISVIPIILLIGQI